MSTSIGAVRWKLKKVSRTAVAHGSRILKAALPAGDHVNTLVRALTYHRFGHIQRDPFCLAPEQFDTQMRSIARAGLAISLPQLESFVHGTAKLPRDAVLVTVDDGFRSLRTVALPILKEHAIPAVAFISASKIATGRLDATPEKYLDWRDLELLANEGISIQSHGLSHHSLCSLDIDRARDELSRSRELLESRVGARVIAFAYPFGTRADYNAVVAGWVREAGYRCAFTAQHGPIRRHDDAFTLSRIKVESGETLATFASLVHGGLDAWRWVDRALWQLQSSR